MKKKFILFSIVLFVGAYLSDYLCGVSLFFHHGKDGGIRFIAISFAALSGLLFYSISSDYIFRGIIVGFISVLFSRFMVYIYGRFILDFPGMIGVPSLVHQFISSLFILVVAGLRFYLFNKRLKSKS